MNPAIPQKSTLLALVLVLLIGAFYLATIREGHVWGDDQAAYIAHAKNIASGLRYGDIGYLRSPSTINPAMYPPGFPLLLAPVYHFYGLALLPMKVLCILFFCGSLFLLFLLLQEEGYSWDALPAVAITGFCPYFWDLKDAILSEFPFLVFAYAALLIYCRHFARRGSPSRQIAWGGASGLLAGLAYSTRSVGILLIAILVLSEIIACRRFTLFSGAATVAFMGVALALKLAFQVESDYLTAYQSSVSLRNLLASPLYYLKCLSVLWDNGRSLAVQYATFMLLGALAVCGIAERFHPVLSTTRGSSRESMASPTSSSLIASHKNQASMVTGIFVLAYFLFICLFPWGGRRYLVPVMPFFVAYSLSGYFMLTRSRSAGTRWALGAGLIGLIVVCFVSKYATLDWREIPGGVQTPGAQDMVNCVKMISGRDGLVVFHSPRFLALHAGTRSTDIYTHENASSVLEYYRTQAVTHVVSAKSAWSLSELSLARLVEEYPEHFNRLYENQDFVIYRFK